MTRSAVNPSEWAAVGYFPPMTETESMNRRKAKLDCDIECSRKIGTILTQWMWNVLLILGMISSVALVAALLIFCGRLIHFCLFA